MSRIRVLDLAKELNIDTKTALAKLTDLGISVKNHFNALSDSEADKLRMYTRSGRNPEKEAAKSANRIIVRRRADMQVSETGSESGAPESPTSEPENAAPQQVQVPRESAPAPVPEATFSVPPAPIATHVEMPVAAGISSPSIANAVTSAGERPADTPVHASEANDATTARPAVQVSAPSPAAQVRTSVSPAAAGPVSAGAPTQDSSVKPSGPASPPSTGATIVRAGSTAQPPTPGAVTGGATVISRPVPGENISATIVRAANQPQVGGAVVLRRADNPAPNPQGGVSTYRPQGPNQGGYRSGYQGGQGGGGGGGYQGGQGGGGYQGGQGGGGYQGGQGGGGYQGGQGGGGYQGGQGGGGYQGGQGGGGYQGGQGAGGGYQGGYRSNTEGGGYRGPGVGTGAPRPGGYGAGAAGGAGFRSADGGTGYQPRPPGTGYGPGAPRPPGTGYPPRPAGTGYPPRPVGTGPVGGRFGTTAPAPEPGTGKEGTARPREKEKELELRRRKLAEEEKKNKGTTKGRPHGAPGGDGGEEELIFGEPIPEGAEGEAVPQVRMVIPNRRRVGGRGRKEHRKQEATPMKESKRFVEVDENITVADLAGALSVKSSAVVKALMGLGMMASVNQILDMETATLVSQEFGYEVRNTTVTISDILKTKKTATTDTEQIEGEARPPVITIMGHVDHGKTSLLDAIRAENVAGGEAGGITQHIGAYQVEHEGRKITFLDTPGHEAFTSMRARGAQVTDVVILVVAADDGVMPQTLEAIAHAKAAKVPIIVAMNKMDKPGVNIERIQREMSGHGVTPEEWGGDSMFIPVSAKTKQGIPELLEAILLQADVLDLNVAKEGLASGFVIEARLDKSRGPVATILVTHGTLRQQDWLVAGTSYGRVRALFDDKGNRLQEAPPATPVEVLGLSEVPAAGDTFNCVVNDAIAKEAVAFRVEKQRQKDSIASQKSSIQEIMAKLAIGDSDKAKELPVIIKADTHGSVEAIRASLGKLDTGKVINRVIHAAVGGITETDVTLAQASNALILGFNVRPDRVASQVAERVGVDVKTFSIIYELIDTVQAAMVGRLPPVRTEKVQGHAEVRNTFSVPKIGVIAGAAVMDGKVTRQSSVRVVRSGIVVYTGRIGSLKRFKDDAKEVVQGFECGLGVENYNDLRVGDVIESFYIEESADTLT